MYVKETVKKYFAAKYLKKSFEYLIQSRKSKGSEINYTKLEMSSYLMPNSKLSISSKKMMFAIRNRMINISENFPSNKNKIQIFCQAGCTELETMKHIYFCKILNDSDCKKIPYNKIFNGNLTEKISIF